MCSQRCLHLKDDFLFIRFSTYYLPIGCHWVILRFRPIDSEYHRRHFTNIKEWLVFYSFLKHMHVILVEAYKRNQILFSSVYTVSSMNVVIHCSVCVCVLIQTAYPELYV